MYFTFPFLNVTNGISHRIGRPTYEIGCYYGEESLVHLNVIRSQIKIERYLLGLLTLSSFLLA